MLKKICLMAAAILLASCAGNQMYYPQQGDKPEGYADEQLSTNLFEVSYETYRKIPWERLNAFALYRAAELGAEKGYKYLIIEGTDKQEFHTNAKIPAITGVTSNVIVDSSGAMAGGNPGVLVPEHVMEYTIHKILIKVSYSNEASQEAIPVASVIASMKKDSAF